MMNKYMYHINTDVLQIQSKIPHANVYICFDALICDGFCNILDYKYFVLLNIQNTHLIRMSY